MLGWESGNLGVWAVDRSQRILSYIVILLVSLFPLLAVVAARKYPDQPHRAVESVAVAVAAVVWQQIWLRF